MEKLGHSANFDEDLQSQHDLLAAIKEADGAQLHTEGVVREFVSSLGRWEPCVLRGGWRTQFEVCRQVKRTEDGDEIGIATLLVTGTDPQTQHPHCLMIPVASTYRGVTMPYEGYSDHSARIVEEQLRSRERLQEMGILSQLQPTCVAIRPA